jgi:hypothetical protein
MRLSCLFACLLFGLMCLVPTLTADEKKEAKKPDVADEKKDAKKEDAAEKKDDKKDAKKADAEKKDEKKDAEKKDDKKDAKKADADEKKKETKKAEPKDKLGTPIVGKLKRVEGAQKYLTVEVAIPAGMVVSGVRTVGKVRVPTYRPQIIRKDFDFQAADEMKVRAAQPPLDYDEKGKPKKYTAKELKEMKGPDPNLPGYMADFDSLKAGQIVKVYFIPPKKDEGKAWAAKDKPKKKDKDGDKDIADEVKAEARMIVIMAEPDAK